MTSEQSLTSRDFPVHWPALTRWTDNDMFGHLNNAVYYQLFDTAINQWLIAGTGVDVLTAPTLVLTAESGCRFLREVGFPQPVVVGVRVRRIGRSSVVYQLGLFADDSSAVAVGHWVHVYVDRASRRSVEMPADVRRLLQTALDEPAPDGALAGEH